MIPACLNFLPYKLLWCDLRVPAAVCAVSADDLGRGVPPPGRALQYSTVYERTVQYSTVYDRTVQYSHLAPVRAAHVPPHQPHELVVVGAGEPVELSNKFRDIIHNFRRRRLLRSS